MVEKKEPSVQQRRSRVVATAWILAFIAVAIFITFILSGVLAR